MIARLTARGVSRSRLRCAVNYRRKPVTPWCLTADLTNAWCCTPAATGSWRPKKLNHLNAFNKLDRQFIRLFNNGATEVTIDTASRILVAKPLVTYAGLTDHVVLFAYGNRIEIWSQANYDEQLNIDADAFSELAEKVMGNNKPATET